MTTASPDHEYRDHHGLLTINASMFAFVVADVIIKLLGRSFPPNELVFLRSTVIVAGLAALMAFRRQRPHLTYVRSFPMLARCFFDCVNTLAFITAVIHMNMAELYAISLTSPFLMTVFAMIFYREKIGYRRWTATVIGFCGALLVIKPNFNTLNQWAMIGFLAAICAAARETVTRKIHRDTSSIEVTLYSAILTGAAALLSGIPEAWVLPTASQAPIVIGQALSWLMGAVLLVEACRSLPLSIVALFRYTLLIWGGLCGYLVFGDVPDYWSVIGITLIVACGLYTFHREALRGRSIASTAVTTEIACR
jgi:drug/metabolite transporter (DMT)-like permease